MDYFLVFFIIGITIATFFLLPKQSTKDLKHVQRLVILAQLKAQENPSLLFHLMEIENDLDVALMKRGTYVSLRDKDKLRNNN